MGGGSTGTTAGLVNGFNTAALFSGPAGVAVDTASGALFIGDSVRAAEALLAVFAHCAHALYPPPPPPLTLSRPQLNNAVRIVLNVSFASPSPSPAASPAAAAGGDTTTLLINITPSTGRALALQPPAAARALAPLEASTTEALVRVLAGVLRVPRERVAFTEASALRLSFVVATSSLLASPLVGSYVQQGAAPLAAVDKLMRGYAIRLAFEERALSLASDLGFASVAALVRGVNPVALAPAEAPTTPTPTTPAPLPRPPAPPALSSSTLAAIVAPAVLVAALFLAAVAVLAARRGGAAGAGADKAAPAVVVQGAIVAVA